MKLKEEIIKILEDNKGNSISGSFLAQKLFVTRNAVWKAISSLRDDGYNIEAVTNKGYMLPKDSNVISNAGISAYLSEEAKKLTLDVRQTVSSTNTVLKEYAREGKKEGYVIVSSEQTAGKGRLGRTFYSPSNTGVYFSILLRPKILIEDSLMITTSAAVAVAKAIEKLSNKKAQIKWVNDVFVENKKVCGILTEAAIDFESGGLEYAIVGIGINVTPPEKNVPDDIKKIAGGFLDDIKGNIRCKLVAQTLNEFVVLMDNLTSMAYLNEYKKRSFLIGKEVNVIKPNLTRKAIALDIDERARLVVKYLDDNTVENLVSGEVSVKLS